MSFFAEVSSLLGFDASSLATGYHFINYNGEAIYVEGFKGVASVTETEIILLLKKSRLTISGENLRIHLLEPSVIIVKGKIVNVSSDNNGG